MILVADEAGDPGVKLGNGSSNHFVVALVIIQTKEDANRIIQAIEQFKQTYLPRTPEIKFQKLHYTKRIKFLQTVGNLPFSVKAMIVEKNQFSQLKNQYAYILELLARHAPSLQDAYMTIDGELHKKSERKMRAMLRQINQNNPQAIKKIKFVNSQKYYLVQLADMMAGSLLRFTQKDKPDCNTYKNLLDRYQKIDDIYYKKA